MTELEHKVSEIDKRQESFETFVRAYIDSNERHMSEIRTDMREMREELKSMGRHVQNLTITAMVGMGAIGVAVVGFIWSMATR